MVNARTSAFAYTERPNLRLSSLMGKIGNTLAAVCPCPLKTHFIAEQSDTLPLLMSIFSNLHFAFQLLCALGFSR